MRTRLLLIALLAVTGLISCNSSTEPDPDPVEPTIRAGSTFTFYREVTDTTWTEVETTDTTTYTVASIDTAFSGKQHAYYSASPDDTLIYTIEQNGDVLFYHPVIEIPNTGMFFPEGWTVLPGASKTASITEFDVDSLGEIEGFPARIEMESKSGYVGESTDSLNGKALTMQKTFIESVVRITVGPQKFTTRMYAEYSFSPELKTFVGYRQKVWSNHDFSPIPNGGIVRTLVDYKL